MSTTATQVYLTPAELAARVQVPQRTLKQWRWRLKRNRGGEKGPAFHRIGGVIRYHIDDVLAWERSRKTEETTR